MYVISLKVFHSLPYGQKSSRQKHDWCLLCIIAHPLPVYQELYKINSIWDPRTVQKLLRFHVVHVSTYIRCIMWTGTVAVSKI